MWDTMEQRIVLSYCHLHCIVRMQGGVETLAHVVMIQYTRSDNRLKDVYTRIMQQYLVLKKFTTLGQAGDSSELRKDQVTCRKDGYDRVVAGI